MSNSERAEQPQRDSLFRDGRFGRALRNAEARLRESEVLNRSIFENPLIGISRALPNGRLIAANEAYARMYGYESSKQILAEVAHVGRQLYANPGDRKRVLDELKRKGVMGPREFEVVRRDGTRMFVLVMAHEVRNAEGQLLCLQAAHLDITRNKFTEDALKASERRYRSLFEQATDGILIMSGDGKSIVCNGAFARMHGYDDPRELECLRLSDLDTPETARLAPERLRRLLAGEAMTFEAEHYHKDGHAFPLSVACSVIEIEGKPFFLGFHRDLTQRKLADERIRMFARELLAVREDEKTQVAAALHHDVGSLAVGLSSHFDAIEEDIRSGRAQAALKWMKKMRKLFEKSIARLKRSAVEIRPPELDVLGLRAALRQLFAKFTAPGKVRIRFRHTPGQKRLPREVSTVVFRIVQEALTNAIRHGRARNIYVTIRVSKKALLLAVANDGSVFRPRQELKSGSRQLGLHMMKEMALSLDGSFDIDSGPGKRTTLRVRIPIKERMRAR